MIFSPQRYVPTDGHFVFSEAVTAHAHPCLDKEIFKEFWHNFAFGCSTLSLKACQTLTFSVGDVAPLPLDGHAYSLRIEPDGLCLSAESEEALRYGFMTLLDRFTARDTDGELQIAIPCAHMWHRAALSHRMVHVCVFPETELWELQRFVRLCGALQYTHVIVEFWGMLRFDCLAELSWKHAFDKEQIRPIVKEAEALGISLVPMFNHWGHATAGRIIHGKHVVLDQNPSLQPYFSEDGWCWNIQNPRVRALLREVRHELMELFASSTYFHIGCDEAFAFDLDDKASRDLLCEYINDIAEDLSAQGRRAIMWGDMLLYPHPSYNADNDYTANAPSPEVESDLLSRLDKRILIADWQYDAKAAPVETAATLTRAGFECLLCPYDLKFPNVSACVETVRNDHLLGLLHTTWHTLSTGMPFVLLSAVGAFEGKLTHTKNEARTQIATLLRKVSPARGDYKKAGWSKQQVSFRW